MPQELALYAIVFFIQLFVLYMVSRHTINELFRFLRLFIKNDHIVFSIVSAVFLPGTILHEMSHFLMATLLLLKVHEVHIFPQWEKNYIKLGRVIYEKRDVFRSIFVGIAPVIIGLLFFWWMSAIDALLIKGIGMQILVVYIIFIISSTMFSSRQDLIDIVYILPFMLLVGIIVYVLQIDISFIFNQTIVMNALSKFLYDVNIYLAISLAIHVVIFIIMRVIRNSFHR